MLVSGRHENLWVGMRTLVIPPIVETVKCEI